MQDATKKKNQLLGEEQKIVEYEMINRAAIQQLRLKMEILNDEFKIRYDHNPIHHVESRLKSRRSIANKLIKKGLEPTVENAIKYINDSYSTEQISIEHLAKMCGITTTHFSRTFKSMYSTTPVKYINNLRLEKACALLTHTSLSIGEISDQCGFADSSYFSKTFKSAYGQSPANYRSSK